MYSYKDGNGEQINIGDIVLFELGHGRHKWAAIGKVTGFAKSFINVTNKVNNSFHDERSWRKKPSNTEKLNEEQWQKMFMD